MQGETIVVSNFDLGETIARQFPHVRQVVMEPATTVPVLRAEGIRRSTGDVVALAEDHCTFAVDWASAVMKIHGLPHAVIGGAVENGAAQSALGWAVYFYDYGRYMLPLTAGPAAALSGNNVSYKRAALLEVEGSFREGLYEPFTHSELARRGHALYLSPEMVVYHQKQYRLGEAAAQAYHLARSFAAKRVGNSSLLKRGAFTGGSLILPLLLPARIAARTLRKGRLVSELLRSLPYLVLLTTSWSWGEFCGYLAGAGSSTSRWK